MGGGSGWENLADAIRDVAAWITVAAGMAAAGVILVGHSSGAQRVLLYQAEHGDPRVRGIVLAFLGEREPGVDAAFDTLRREATGVPALESRIIPGGDHVSSGVEGDVVRAVAEWADQLASP
jgi:pimeloyl-ACP methyl ester carboxylesterase